MSKISFRHAFFPAAFLWGLLAGAPRPVHAEEFVFELEWGFGPQGSEMYWDGTFQVTAGRIVSMEAVSFEADRHDKLSPPAFQSYTVNNGTDGLRLTVEGNEETAVRLQSKEGTFEWSVRQMRRTAELTFASKSKGSLAVRRKQFLGGMPRLLSDTTTQDSVPVICRLGTGRLVVLFRGFLRLPAAGTPGGDQLRAVVIEDGARQGKIFDLLDGPADVGRLAAAPAGASACRIVWCEERGRNWDLYTSRLELKGGKPAVSKSVRLTDDPGVDRAPALAALPGGSTLLVWQGWRGTRSRIFARRLQGESWSAPVCLSRGSGNCWNPAVAVFRGGAAAAVWSCWRNGSYDVHLSVLSRGDWTPPLEVAGSERFEAHPAAAYDRSGTLWIAYEEGRAGWGMHSHTAGLRSLRNLRLRMYRSGRIEEPAGTAAWNLPASFENSSEMGHLACDDGGVLWLLFRRLRKPGVWTVFGSSLGDAGWSAPVPLRSSAGGQDVRMSTASGPSGRLAAVWVSDHRTRQFGKDSRIYTTTLPARKTRTRPVQGKAAAPRVRKVETPATPERPAIAVAGRKLGLYFGDLHRHTELSVCRTGVDGSLEDAHRYAIDAAGLDFLCITDHVQHVKILNDFDYWRTGKTADLNRVKGLHLPFYGYERSQRWPYGHRNIIGLVRSPKRIPRTADNRPWDANHGYPGEVRVSPPELWSRLFGKNVITIPHTTGNPVMGTNFGDKPPAIEPVVEIYQGCRFSYEHAGAPDPRRTRDGGTYGGATKAGGFIWDALAKGYRYGFIASSDHVATHNSYACVWAEEFSNASILEALRKRRCYAATDKIVCDMRMGGHIMGSEFSTDKVPPLAVKVTGTAPVARVDVIKDNRVVFASRPDRPLREVQFTYADSDVSPGTHYYYARVIQEDHNMAWVTPIWVDVTGKK